MVEKSLGLRVYSRCGIKEELRDEKGSIWEELERVTGVRSNDGSQDMKMAMQGEGFREGERMGGEVGGKREDI